VRKLTSNGLDEMFRSLGRFRVLGPGQDIVPIGQHSEEEGGIASGQVRHFVGSKRTRGLRFKESYSGYDQQSNIF
jgi:hypothetical protein